jgi:hypothetical protein
MLLVVRRKLYRIKEFVAIPIIPRRSRETEKAANSTQTDRESEKASMLVCSVRISDFALPALFVLSTVMCPSILS